MSVEENDLVVGPTFVLGEWDPLRDLELVSKRVGLIRRVRVDAVAVVVVERMR